MDFIQSFEEYDERDDERYDENEFNLNELKYITVYFTQTCKNGYKGSFDNWFNVLIVSRTPWRKIANINNKKNDKYKFNLNELRHIAINFAISCEKGYEGDFDRWFKTISPKWRKIANRKS